MSNISLSNSNGNNSDNQIAFFTRQEDGESGMTVTALGHFCGVGKSVVSELLSKIRDSDSFGNKLPECLKPFTGKEQRVIVNAYKNSLYVKDELCHAILEYYTFDAREYKGKDIAIENYKTFAKAGVRVYIWSQTGYTPETLKPSETLKNDQAETLKPDRMIELFKLNVRQATRLNDRAAQVTTMNQISAYIDKFLPSRHSEYSESDLPTKDSVKTKIFQDLVKACKGQAKTVTEFSSHSLIRRKDLIAVYGAKGDKFLKKTGIVALFQDAAKHGYGSFEGTQKVFEIIKDSDNNSYGRFNEIHNVFTPGEF